MSEAGWTIGPVEGLSVNGHPEPMPLAGVTWLPTSEPERPSPLWSTTYVIRQEPRWVARMRKYVRL